MEKINKELKALIIKRIEAMPKDMKIAILGEVYTKEKILNEIKEGTAIGEEFLKMEVDYYNYLLKT